MRTKRTLSLGLVAGLSTAGLDAGDRVSGC
jgi:hypothetical protein